MRLYLRGVTADHDIFDRPLLRRRRDRAAADAARHEFLLARVADDMEERLMLARRRLPLALSLGAHHGLLGRRLGCVAGVETVIEAESSAGLLAQCGGLRVRADDEMLPFRDQSLDLVVSGLSLHLVNDLPGALVQIRRALKPDGLMLAWVLGGATLWQLRGALLAAEEEMEGGASPRVAPFADVRDYGALLQRAKFALPVVDADTVTVTYADPLALMREIRAMGAANALRARRRTPLRRATLMRALKIYADRFALPDGRVPATFEIITLTGWAPHESQQQPLQPGSARMRLADALGTTEVPTGDKAEPAKRDR
ncbi:MAG: methyltransferase domain-containing protein [Hyphomicrobiaceae bacterium]|nr:MAG: methyltransferase domain-containing protein [Hyphomicrobiaceae bacterium]